MLTRPSVINQTPNKGRTVDGADGSLIGRDVPAIVLESSSARPQDLSALVQTSRLAVVYFYPCANSLPVGPDITQHRSFAERSTEFSAEECRLVGVSTEPADRQAEAVRFRRLSYPLLSDPLLLVAKTLKLPTLRDGSHWHYCRQTLLVQYGVIVKFFFPVQEAALNAGQVLNWIRKAKPTGLTKASN
jgi:peroxiredoxin